MHRFKKLLVLLLAAAALCSLAVGISACADTDKTIAYTVTVTCEDPSVLADVKVQLGKDGTSTEEKPLEAGKATFELEAGSYRVILTGVPDTYEYPETTLTERSPSATVALTAKQAGEELVTYTVTVVCDDDISLDGVKVQLKKGAENAGEKELEDGKASFELEAGTYTATLTGCPEDYTYEPQTLTAVSPAATIRLTKQESAAVEVTVSVKAGKDVFGADRPKTPLGNAKVAFYASATDLKPLAEGVTDENGKANFAIPAGVYLANVNGAEIENFKLSGTAAEIELQAQLGSKTAPFVWKEGANELPFTRETLEALGDGSVYCTFVAAKSGLYSFDADNYNANVESDLFEDGLIGMSDHVTATLEAGVVYTFACTSTGALGESGEFGYRVTVTEGDTKEGGDAPAVPWTGSGTEQDPYLLQTLKNSYRVQIKYENGAYVPVYFKYTETAAAKYAIYSTDQNFYMTVGDRHYTGGGDASSELSLFETETGKDYLFALSPFDDEGTENVIVSFTIGDYTGYIPKWEGGGKFSSALGVDDPYLIETLVDSYEVHGADRVYFKYAATETKNYTVTLEGTDGFDLLLRNYNNGKPDSGNHYTLSASHKTAVISLTAGTTYLFGVLGGDDGLDGNLTFVVNFTIAEGGTPDTETPEQPGDGTKANPFALDDILGEHTLKVSAEGLYYTFTVQKTGVYGFTAVTALYLSDFQGVNGQVMNTLQGSKGGETKDYNLIAGIVYTFRLSGYGPSAATTTEVTLKAEFKREADVVYIPSEFNGKWKDVNEVYSLTIASGGVTLMKGEDKVDTIVTEKISSDMEGKTSYFLTFESKTYTLQWNSVGDKALQLFLDQDNVIYFAPDPLPSFAFDEALQGEYAAREGEYAEHITVAADGVEWENHTVLLLSDMTSAYDGYEKAFAAYVDGKPELLLFGNGAIYFQKANLYFDNGKSEGELKLPADYRGVWKSADGTVSLDVGESSVVLKENGVQAEVSLKQGKVGIGTEYFLVWKGKDWQFTTLAQGILTLQGETTLHFAKDPLPTVDLSGYIGVYACSLSVDYLVVEKNAIRWGDRAVTLAAAPSVTAYGTGYPFFADGKLYLFFIDTDGESFMLFYSDGGEDADLTYVGTTVPQADGSEAKPYILEEFLGEQTFSEIPEDGAYYAFELPFGATLIFTAGTANIDVTINTTLWQPTRTGEQVDLKCSAGAVKLKLSGADTISLTIAIGYTVTVSGADKDVYGNTLNETLKENVSVTLIKGGAEVQTLQTDGKGVAVFPVTEEGEYSAKIDGSLYAFTGASCAVLLTSDVVLGSSAEHPLALKMGTNEFALTQEIMETYQGVYYSFVCTYTGTYLFTVSEKYAMFLLAEGDDPLSDDPSIMLGENVLTQSAKLEKGKTYSALVVSQGTAELAYALTISLDVGEIEGEGTKDSPEVLRGFGSVARFTGTDANTSYYFRFITDKSYSVVIKASKNCRIGGALVGFNTQQLAAGGTVTVELKKGVATDFYVQALLNEGADIIELTFEATEVADAPWTGSGTSADPYRPENFVGEYELNGTANKYIYFEYTVAQDVTYRVTYLGGVPLTFYLPSAGTMKFTGTGKANMPSSAGTDTFSVKAGTKFVFRIYPDASGSLKFKIEEVSGT